MPSLPPYLTKHVNKSTTKQTSLPQQRPFTSQSETVDKSSIINSFTGEINTYAQSASNTLTEFLGRSFKWVGHFYDVSDYHCFRRCIEIKNGLPQYCWFHHFYFGGEWLVLKVMVSGFTILDFILILIFHKIHLNFISISFKYWIYF